MPGCDTCIHRVRSKRDAEFRAIDIAPKAECKQHTGYDMSELVLPLCSEHQPITELGIALAVHDRPDALH